MRYDRFQRGMNLHLEAPMVRLGFSQAAGPYFARARCSWKDVVFYDLDRASKDRFSVCFGIHIPSIAQELAEIADPELPSPFVYRFLGQGGELGGQRWYGFKEVSLAAAVEIMVADFTREAEPWLHGFGDIRQVCEAYYDQRVSVTGAAKSDPIAWAVYGLLLKQAKCDDADQWLRRSLEEVSRPLFLVGGRVSSESAPGAKKVSRPPQEQALRSLLERRYGSNELHS